MMYQFWYNEIKNRKLYHGTSVFYLDHLKKCGLGPKRPFVEEFTRMIKFYQKYKSFSKSPYFDWFIERFLDKGVAKLSFTFDKDIAENEFAKGERRGGEWLKALNQFLWFLNNSMESGEVKLSKEDLAEKKFLEEFIKRANKHKGMLISIKCGNPILDTGANLVAGCRI